MTIVNRPTVELTKKETKALKIVQDLINTVFDEMPSLEEEYDIYSLDLQEFFGNNAVFDLLPTKDEDEF